MINVLAQLSHMNILILATHGFQLLMGEQAVSIASCSLGSQADAKSNTYYVVGTAMISPNEKEPKHGRILVFQVTASEFTATVHDYTVHMHVRTSTTCMCVYFANA